MTDRQHILTALLAMGFMAGTVFLWPNGLDPRIQRMLFFTLTMTIIASVYVFLAVDWSVGLLAVYAVVELMRSDARPTEYVIFSLCIFYAAWCWVHDHGSEWAKNAILDCVVLMALINFAFQMLNIQGVQLLIWSPIPDLYPGFMGNHGETSVMYAMALPAFFRGWKRLLIPIVIIGLLLAKEHVGVMAVFVMSVFFIIRNYRLLKKISWMIFISAAVILAISISLIKPLNFQTLEHQRMKIWDTTITVAAVKPVIGWGFNQYGYVMSFLTSLAYLPDDERRITFASIRDTAALNKAASELAVKDKNFFFKENQFEKRVYQAHNEYVEWFFIAGVFGFLILLIAVGRKLAFSYFAAEPIAFYGLVGAVFCAFFWFIWHLMPFMLLTLIYVGMVPRKAVLKWT